MARNIQPNPFETSEADKAANLARVKRERDELDAVRGFGNPGVIGDAINNTLGERIMDSKTVNEAADRAFGDPDAILGGLAVGTTELPRTIRGKLDKS